MKRFLTLLMVLGLTAGSVATAQAKKMENDSAALVKVVASDGMPSDRFGVSVAVSGDTALVGAPTEDAERGAAYVFTRVDGAWTEQAKLVASDGRSLRKFGYSVALSGDTAVVGGSTGVIGGSDVHADRTPGAAYVFKRVGNTWIEQAKLTAGQDGVTGDDFGTSVAVSGDTVVVGAGGVGVGGAAYVFAKAGEAWPQQAKLTAEQDAAVGDKFGYSVSVSGDIAVVGSQLDDVESTLNQGSAYVFSRDGELWSREAHLAASDGGADDNFGFSVTASGDMVVVGAWHDDVNGNQDQGSAYVFARSDTTWIQQKQLIAADGASGDEFGRSTAVSGDTAVIGAGFHNLHRGAAYVWERAATCQGKCRSSSASGPVAASPATRSPATTPMLPAVG